LVACLTRAGYGKRPGNAILLRKIIKPWLTNEFFALRNLIFAACNAIFKSGNALPKPGNAILKQSIASLYPGNAILCFGNTILCPGIALLCLGITIPKPGFTLPKPGCANPSRLIAFSVVTGSAARNMDDAPFWTGKPDVTTFTKMQDERLAKAQQILNQALAVKGKRTIENTLKPYDEVLIYLDAAGSQSGLIQEVHPEEAMRNAAGKLLTQLLHS
jgi:hypothetical protein